MIVSFEASKENLDGQIYDFVICWIDTNNWIEALENTSKNFLKHETRQKSALVRFFKCLELYFDPSDEQTIWKGYGQSQHYCTTVIESKYRNPVRNLLHNIYLYTIENYKDYKDGSHLKSILLKNELLQGAKQLEDPLKILTTNFPPSSEYYQVVSIECRAPRNGKEPLVYYSNLYINTENKFILNFVHNYLLDMKKYDLYTKYNTPFYRTFIYYFGKSLSKNIQSFTDFNKDTFLEQFKYYSELDRQGKIPSKYKKSIVADLARIYRFIENEYMTQNGGTLFNDPYFNIRFLKSNLLKKSYEEDYLPVVINPYETVPESNKWIIVPPLDNKSYNMNIYRALSFNDVENLDLREMLKSYLWSSVQRDPIDRFSHLVKFLNDMDSNISKQLHSDKRSFFDSEFLTYYYVELCDRTDIGDQMINSVIYSIRRFLRFVQSNYTIPEYVVSMYKELPKKEYHAGTPINNEDLKEINKAFLNSKNIYVNELYIVFKLSLMTKLRPNEILGLERDCITSKNDKFGTISYYSKTNKNDKTYATFTIDIIRDIEKAIELTTPVYEIAREHESKYIFIGKVGHKVTSATDYNVVRLIPAYRKLFHGIIKNLYDKNKISQWYTTYSCRDTHINNAFELLEDDKITLHEITTITGNTVNIARKHYLSKDRRTKKYLENMFEVTLLDQPIIGDIHGNDIPKYNQPIQNGMGNCSSNKCVKIDTVEDSSYKCLTCKYFVTTLDKIQLFENRVKELKILAEKSENKVERNFYKHSLELNLRYLGEMYAMKGASK